LCGFGRAPAIGGPSASAFLSPEKQMPRHSAFSSPGNFRGRFSKYRPYISQFRLECVMRNRFLALGLVLASFADTAAHAAVCRVTTGGSGTNDGSNWASSLDLQTALGNAGCAEIWVAQGTYKPTAGTNRTISFNVMPGVAVYGGFIGTETTRDARNPAANLTVLSGDLNGNDTGAANGVDPSVPTDGSNSDNSYHVVLMDGTTSSGIVTSSTVLDGVVITAGNANGTSSPDSNGGGLYCNGAGNGYMCSPELVNLTFSGNSASVYGGAMFNSGVNMGASSPVLTNVNFTGNRAGGSGGAMLNAGEGGDSSPMLTDVSFSGNSANNRGGAMDNWCDLGGVSLPILTNITFSGNTAGSSGGAIYNYGSGGTCNPTLTNITFNGNSAQSGGAIYNYGPGGSGTSRPTLINVILWGDNLIGTGGSGAEIVNFYGANPAVDHSIVQGGCPAGSTCTSLYAGDPILGVLTNNGGFTQTMLPGTGSAAIDAGLCHADNSTVPADDQRGLPRPQGAACDIGAVEVAVATTLAVAVSGSGSVDATPSRSDFLLNGDIASCTSAGGSNCSASFVQHTVVTLAATADAHWHFEQWGGKCVGTSVNSSVMLDVATSCTAMFVIDSFTLTYATDGNGTISGTSLQTVNYGADGTAVTAAPNSGYHFVQWSDGHTDNPRTDTDVTADISATASFAQNPPPTANAQSANVAFDTAQAIALTGSDANPGGPFTFTYAIAANPSNGSISNFDANAGTLTYRPNPGYSGSDTFTFTVTDANGTSAPAIVDLVVAALPAHLVLSIQDASAYARYDQYVDYQVTLSNDGGTLASGIVVAFSLSSGFDGQYAQLACISSGGGTDCEQDPGDPFHFTAALPPGRNLTWLVNAPVLGDTRDANVEFGATATGAQPVTDTNTLVIFRDGFDVPYADGTQ
jgi:hypothetical protein